MWESMDVVLQKHEAKHIYKVPEGLRELCSDISREVLRSQPGKIYQFIADYVNALLITRENTKVAVQLVGNILSGSEAIVNILFQTRLTLEQIVAVAPRVQKAFRDYLDSIDQQDGDVCEGYTCEEKSKSLLKEILEATGATEKQAHQAATVIQSAFRGHYERMKLNEAKGLIMWQRAVGNTLNILKKAGVPQREIMKAAPLIQFAYQGYYARRNIKIKEACQPDEELKLNDVIEPRDNLQAVAWLDMLFEESGLTIERANEAAYIIQRAYRQYRVRKEFQAPKQVESSRSMVVEAIIEQLRQKVFETVMARTDVPTEYGSRQEMETSRIKLEIMYKEHVRRSRLSAEGPPMTVDVPKEVSAHEEALSEAEEAEEKEKETFADDPSTEEKMGTDVDQRLSDVEDKSEHEIQQSVDEEQPKPAEEPQEIDLLPDEEETDTEQDQRELQEEEVEEAAKESIDKLTEETGRPSREKTGEEAEEESQVHPTEDDANESIDKRTEETERSSRQKSGEDSHEHETEDAGEDIQAPVEKGRKESHKESIEE